jgi:hypothetical protein
MKIDQSPHDGTVHHRDGAGERVDEGLQSVNAVFDGPVGSSSHTDQRPVSVLGWGLALVSGIAIWALIYFLIW